MNQPPALEKSRPRWKWRWLIAVGCCIGLGLGLAVPRLRQEWYIRQLTARGFSCVPDYRRSSPAMVQLGKWLRQPALAQYVVEYHIHNPSAAATCTAEDYLLLDRLLTVEETSPFPVPRCWLSLYLKNLEDEDLEHFHHPYKILNLVARAPHLTDAGLHQLRRATYLVALRLEAPLISDQGLEKLQWLEQVVDLRLSGKGITNAGLIHLQRKSMLRYLRLADAQITDEGLSHLAKLPSLQYIDLTGCKITDAGLVELKPLKTLTFLNLTRTPVTRRGLANPLRVLTDIHYLEVRTSPSETKHFSR